MFKFFLKPVFLLLIFLNLGFFILIKFNYQPLKNILTSRNEVVDHGEEMINLYKVADVPVLIENDDLFQFLVSSPSYLVYDRDSEMVLFSKNTDEEFYPASTVKLMTALVVLDVYNLDEEITIESTDLKFGNHLGFYSGEKLKVIDLLKAMLIASSNEAAYILASHSQLSAGYEEFIDLMNLKAKELQLEKAVFINPIGLDNLKQKTNAKDLLKLTKTFLNQEVLKNIVAMKTTKVSDSLKAKTHLLKNTNQLLDDETYFGVKTGTTRLASQVLISLVKKDKKELIIVVLKSKDRYNDTANLFKNTFKSYNWLAY
jgi:D-alanyl-D-alanine carboxypeptidase (penicillin-binding protein 5/6)